MRSVSARTCWARRCCRADTRSSEHARGSPRGDLAPRRKPRTCLHSQDSHQCRPCPRAGATFSRLTAPDLWATQTQSTRPASATAGTRQTTQCHHCAPTAEDDPGLMACIRHVHDIHLFAHGSAVPAYPAAAAAAPRPGPAAHSPRSAIPTCASPSWCARRSRPDISVITR